jgi:hypothetical protein
MESENSSLRAMLEHLSRENATLRAQLGAASSPPSSSEPSLAQPTSAGTASGAEGPSFTSRGAMPQNHAMVFCCVIATMLLAASLLPGDDGSSAFLHAVLPMAVLVATAAVGRHGSAGVALQALLAMAAARDGCAHAARFRRSATRMLLLARQKAVGLGEGAASAASLVAACLENTAAAGRLAAPGSPPAARDAAGRSGLPEGPALAPQHVPLGLSLGGGLVEGCGSWGGHLLAGSAGLKVEGLASLVPGVLGALPAVHAG